LEDFLDFFCFFSAAAAAARATFCSSTFSSSACFLASAFAFVPLGFSTTASQPSSTTSFLTSFAAFFFGLLSSAFLDFLDFLEKVI